MFNGQMHELEARRRRALLGCLCHVASRCAALLLVAVGGRGLLGRGRGRVRPQFRAGRGHVALGQPRRPVPQSAGDLPVLFAAILLIKANRPLVPGAGNFYFEVEVDTTLAKMHRSQRNLGQTTSKSTKLWPKYVEVNETFAKIQ